MAQLATAMPAIAIAEADLARWGALWRGNRVPETGKDKKPDWFTKKQSVNFTAFVDKAVADALAQMLGGIEVIRSGGKTLRPAKNDCVEWGSVRIVGGVRPQNFDVAYRPDGARVAFDSKTLNDLKSVGKNWQNMINDLATEAATVHTRFPYAVVAFMVLIPAPALGTKQEADIIRTLERLGSRSHVLDQSHLAEVLSVVVWDPDTGAISPDIPPATSTLRVEKFSDALFPHYIERYKGLPPHDEQAAADEDERADEDEGIEDEEEA